MMQYESGGKDPMITCLVTVKVQVTVEEVVARAFALHCHTPPPRFIRRFPASSAQH